MPYNPTVWVDDGPPPIDQSNLNKIEGGIQTAQADVEALATATTAALAGKVDKSLVDAAGDLLVGSAPDTVSRLGPTTDGHVLTLDSGEALGVKWEAPSGGSGAGQGFFSTLGDSWAYGMVTGTNIAWSLANRAVFTRVTPSRDMAITKLTWRLNSGSGNYDIGLYDGATLARLWSKGSTALPAGGVVVETVSPTVNLTAGTPYYVAFALDGTQSLLMLNPVSSVRDVGQYQIDGVSGQAIQNAAFPLPDPAVVSAANVLPIPYIVLREA